jgi:hypothetical protein
LRVDSHFWYPHNENENDEEENSIERG